MILNARPLYENKEIMGFILSFTDITERKKGEEQREQLLHGVRQARDELEDRVKERTAKIQESEQRLKQLAADLIKAEETERRRIAHELHDSLAAQLAAIKYRVEQRFHQTESEEISVTINDTIQDIQNAISETRRIMANLRPSVLDDLGIVPALSWFCRETQKTYPETVMECTQNVEEREVPEELKTVLFRVVQESTTNAIRHGKSKRIRIALQRNDGWLRLSVADDGTGFDSARLEKQSESEGIGMQSMQQRVESTAGIFSIISRPGKGATVNAEWRLK